MQPSLLKLAVLAVLAATARCLAAARTAGRSSGPLRVVGGLETTIEEHNYQVSMQRAGTGQHECGGSILSDTWILSAAHCFLELSSPSDWQVRVGTSTWADGGVVHEVDRVAPWPEFSLAAFQADVALVHLKTPIAFNERAQPIPWARRGARGQATPGTYVTVTGWGQLGYFQPELPDTLRLARLRVMHPDLCALAYSAGTTTFADTMVCASAYAKDSCTGDSGGPLVTDKRVQVGIVSWGQGCADYGHPGVYTDLSHPDVYDFIEQTMAEEGDITDH